MEPLYSLWKSVDAVWIGPVPVPFFGRASILFLVILELFFSFGIFIFSLYVLAILVNAVAVMPSAAIPVADFIPISISL